MMRSVLTTCLVALSCQAAFAFDRGLTCTSGAMDTTAGPLRKILSGDELQVLALTADGRLFCFEEDKPTRGKVLSTVNGLQTDTKLVGIDFRVQDGQLYGVGDAGGVYLIQAKTGVATLVNRLSVALQGSLFGVDFNPAADRLRIVSDAGQNLRHNVNAGGVTLADGALNYTAGTAASGVVGAAYTNNDVSPAMPASTGTTLFVLDTAQDQIALQSPPNGGSLVPTGKLTLDGAAVAGFDIYSVLRDGITVSNRALATLVASDGAVTLYDVDVLTGKATRKGALPTGLAVVDIAIPLSQP